MKTLIVILVLFCSISAKAEKLEGLFGVKIGEILTKELKVTMGLCGKTNVNDLNYGNLY